MLRKATRDTPPGAIRSMTSHLEGCSAPQRRRHLRGDRSYPHNAGVHDRKQRPAPLTRDFIFAGEDPLPRVRHVEVDGRTRSSDHQPQLPELA